MSEYTYVWSVINQINKISVLGDSQNFECSRGQWPHLQYFRFIRSFYRQIVCHPKLHKIPSMLFSILQITLQFKLVIVRQMKVFWPDFSEMNLDPKKCSEFPPFCHVLSIRNVKYVIFHHLISTFINPVMKVGGLTH